MHNLQNNIIAWVRTHRAETLLLCVILLISAFMRLYRISEYMTFLGDEGRDAIIVRNIFVKLHPPLIGPGTSIGNMYLGPLYYYLSAPFSFLSGFSPVGPSVMVALFGIATVFLIWWMGKEWFGNVAGLLAAFFYAISPVVIIYNRSSWNPNVMPFFSTLCVYAIWRVWNKDEWKWLVVLGISFAFVLQTHYLGLLLAPVFGLFLVLTTWKLYNSKSTGNWKLQIRNFRKYAFIGLVVFLLLMSPLVIFDARHGWNNTTAIKTFFTDRQDTVSARPWSSIPKLLPLWQEINTRLLAGTDKATGRSVANVSLLGAIIVFLIRWKRKQSSYAYLLLLVWIGISLLGLGSYKHELYDHYYGFLFTAPFLLLGGVTQDLIDIFRDKRLGWKAIFYRWNVTGVVYTLLILFLFAIFIVNVANNPLQYPPNRQLQRSIAVTKKIEEEAQGKELNLAVIAERNYEGAYQYFLEKDNTGFVKIDPQDTANTIADQLFVVCELSREKCDPTHNPKAEVANFGWSMIDKEWNIDGVILYKLVHTEQ